ncbi:menaquinone biosynthesis protein [Flaviaesturariibacter amylovorans]|uniref:Chorismate dehydratase n=1 Tax=Flaviaesturariibacter amylovorans TaxID=1084520 RepID=A0ABP8H3A0_9BACT
MKKIRVAAVSYLNTRPLMYGIRRHPVINEIDLVEDYPARIAQLLVNDEVDMGLVPVAIIPKLEQAFFYTDFCIGASGPVDSVCLFSEVPIEEVTEVYLDYQSRTSVLLATVLLKEYWNSTASLIPASGEDYRDRIRGNAAGLVIGDRAFEQRLRSPYIYDLAEHWQQFTGLPFVFAAWIANKELPADFVSRFNAANADGLNHIPEVVAAHPYPHFDLTEYYTRSIDYCLDQKKREAIALFLEKSEPYR